MEVKIGMQHVARELNIDVDQSADEVSAAVSSAMQSNTPLVLADSKGRSVTVMPATIAYVELGVENNQKVGFGA